MIPRVNFASKLCRNKFFPLIEPGKKLSPSFEGPGTAGVVAMPLLRRLGLAVTALGRITEDDEPGRLFLEADGIEIRMEKVKGRGAIDAVVGMDQPAVLGVFPGFCDWAPTSSEGAYLSHCQADAMVLSGSLPHEYAAFLIDTAAARGQRVFQNASGTADLKLAGFGKVILQISFAEFSNGRLSPRELARQTLEHSGAEACILTAAARGSWTATSAERTVLHTPGLRLPPDNMNRTLGAGDAHFAGLVAGYLLAIGENRLERALKLARLVAAYHVSGSPSGSWSQLGLFEKRDADEKTNIRSAA